MKKEMRVFVVNSKAEFLRGYMVGLGGEQFMELANKHNSVYELKDFQKMFNEDLFDTQFCEIRFIEVEIPEFTPEQEKQIELLEKFRNFTKHFAEYDSVLYTEAVKEFIKNLGES